MIATSSLLTGARNEKCSAAQDTYLLDALRAEAAQEVRVAFDGVSQKRITSVALPGCGRGVVIRALGGFEENAMYRVVALFVLMRRLGLGRERAVRMAEWIRAAVDWVWPPKEMPTLAEVLETDADLDVRDDPERLRAVRGDDDAVRRCLDAKLAQMSHAPTVIRALRQTLYAAG